MEYAKFAYDVSYRLAASEIEAAEALAGLVRGSSFRLEDSTTSAITSQTVPPLSSDPNTAARFEKTDGVAGKNPVCACCAVNPSKPAEKLRRKLTEAEREERRIRRVLANRESARQTIRRRQAMFQELTRKAAELSEENEKLRNMKELLSKECNSRRDRNVRLKAQLAELKRSLSCAPTTASSSQPPPSAVPPSASIQPSEEEANPQFHLYPFPIPPPNSTLVFVPVPCFFPLVAQTPTVAGPPCPPAEEDEGRIKKTGSGGRQRKKRSVSNVLAAGEARWRRKELMRLKHNHHQPPPHHHH